MTLQTRQHLALLRIRWRGRRTVTWEFDQDHWFALAHMKRMQETKAITVCLTPGCDASLRAWSGINGPRRHCAVCHALMAMENRFVTRGNDAKGTQTDPA